MPENCSIVTTSWDDGDPLDLHLAEMLSDRELPGTFYVPLNYGERARLSDYQLRELADQGFEIGAHGVRHCDLRTLDDHELGFELSGAKTILEQTLGQEVHTLCYPCGQYDSRVIQQARSAGYLGARTTRMLSWSGRFSNFQMPVTVQALAHRWSAYCKNLLKRGTVADLAHYFRHFAAASWVEIAKATFDFVQQDGGVWHLYGHSWEIEQHGQWKQLREVLDYVSHRQRILYLTNKEVLEHVSRSSVSAAVA